MAAVYLGDYTLLGRRPVLLYSLGMAALAVLIQRGGMRVGGISYTLLGPVLYALLVYGLRGKGWRGLLLALAGLVPPVVLPCLIPNFTSGAIAGLSGAAVVLTAAWKGWMGVPRKKGAAAVAVGLLVLNGAALWHLSQSPYALERVRFALHPELDPLGLGYFPMMVREMLSGAQWLGKGELGELSGAAGYLPGVSDYWLARVIHELGWAAGLALLALMTALFALGLRRCMRQRGMLGRLLSTAALTTLVLETVCFVVYDLGFPLAAPAGAPLPVHRRAVYGGQSAAAGADAVRLSGREAPAGAEGARRTVKPGPPSDLLEGRGSGHRLGQKDGKMTAGEASDAS